MRRISLTVFIAFFMASGTLVSRAETVPEEIITMSGFIETAKDDPTVRNQGEIKAYIDGASESTPYLNRLEFRTKTERFEADREKYGLRFYPKGWGETENSKLLSESVKASCRSEYDSSINNALKERYRLVLDLMETGDLMGLKEKMAAVYTDRVTVLKKKNSGGMSFDISDLVEAEEQLVKIRLELVSLENRKNGIVEKIRVASDSKARPDFSLEPLISIERVREFTSLASNINEIDNTDLRDRKSRVDVARNKYNLEEAKSRDYISFVEVSYDHEKSDDYEKAYALEIGIKLPFINSDQDDINRKKIGYMKERLSYEQEKRELSEKISSISRSVERLISQYEIIENSRLDVKGRESIDSTMKSGGADPLNILRLREALIKKDIHLVQTGYEIRNKYVDLLDITGKLSESPVRNLLSEKKEVLW